MTKQLITADLHTILFGTNYQSDPNNWELNKSLAKGLLTHHGVYFLDRDQVADNEHWQTDDVQEYFFNVVCPGVSLGITAFEVIADRFIDWDMYEVGKTIGTAFNDIADAVRVITNDYSNHMELPTKGEMATALNTLTKKAA